MFIEISHVSAWYGKSRALADVSLEVPEHCIYAFIGPSGCGKTTLLRSVNRLNDFVPGFRLEGDVNLDGADIYKARSPRFAEELRRGIGMVFQHTNPLPMTVMQNMLLPVREHLKESKEVLRAMAEDKLKLVGLFDELSGRFDQSALRLSGGQQQRLCIARALMLEPKLLLMDEPCSALDPISTFRIEELLTNLKERYTIVMVTHNMEQARRISDYTSFFYQGRLAESGKTLDLFSFPREELTQNYLTGRI
ncbi:phosphate ABC transporter ATP-binding protein [Papillibacter cinnamivorans]|uniref:Phosphate transport system ATP-binding protein n=1 Tax=Papillibacter cinnamivorans DSM 12816 TaxID=1122930 RepID=A0A1W1YNG8_9FIRM|nr:phosphate ABC transporter ATP-binding protein [Papillibacter cinnamivorans]SMC37760.1 phosphate transport system ATP-binding protein [Papillibacter cinnamivorans DSM 12816]